jgi:hypothetical protein
MDSTILTTLSLSKGADKIISVITEVIMERKLFLLLIIAWFLLIGCAPQQLRKDKEVTLDKLGPFKLNERKHFYETLDELANQLKASPYYVVLKKKETKLTEGFLLELIDRDGDGKAEQFWYLPKKGGETQDFGFIFDLNNDGKVDYIVFNGGLAPTRDMKLYWWKNHWIDSNYDGKIDIVVFSVVDLDGDKFPDEGMTAWTYDTDFDGIVDKAEYSGKNFQKPIEKTDGFFMIKLWTGEIKLEEKVGLSYEPILTDINSIYR